MAEVIDFVAVRAQMMLADLEADLESGVNAIARTLWAQGYRHDSTIAMVDAITQAEEICRARGYDEERVAAFGRLFARLLHKHLVALEPVPVRR